MPKARLGAVVTAFALCFGSLQAQETKYADFKQVTDGAQVHEGLIKLYRKKDRLYAELAPTDFNKEFLFLPSLSRGIGEGRLLGGMSLNFGDDWLLTFRQVDDRVHLVRLNVRFRAQEGTPAEQAVKNSYTDSVVAALPIVSKSPTNGTLIDLSAICLSDFVGLAPSISQTLSSGYSFDAARSTYNYIKNFPQNIEIDVSAVYGSGRAGNTDNVPDPRGVQFGVHYSISHLPKTTYQPRLADPRVGYFLTAVKDYTKETTDSAFIRYINRWHLEKADPNANPSPPKKAIRFYVEQTVPYRWRPYVKEGILAWNKAFEKLGYANAIEVMDLPPDADPEDIRYNTFRWITTGAGFAMGPSRVHPRTGQILDADIIFDSDMVRFWQLEYEDVIDSRAQVPQAAAMSPKPTDPFMRITAPAERSNDWCSCQACDLGAGFREQMGMMALAHLAVVADKKELPDELIGQAIREVTMHEVGHTLGLRHNFKASSWKSLAEINAAKPGEPTVGSVMDYIPANIQPKGKPQGQYFPSVIGPYDEWAIEFGYSVIPDTDKNKLAEIASRSGRSEFVYATDEDTRSLDPDPLSARFDLGNDPIANSRHDIELVQSLLPGIAEKVTAKGEGYQKVRRAFSMLLSTYLRASNRALGYIGGAYTTRSHKGDPDAKAPFTMVEAARQREALDYLMQNLFSDAAYQFPPELLNMLAPNRFSHWGTTEGTRLDYPLHEVILRYQTSALASLLSSNRLERVQDAEKRYPKDAEPFTMSELFRRLSDGIWKEIDGPAGKLTVSSFRRNLQREHIKLLSRMRLESGWSPEDARSLASMHLRELEAKVGARVKDAGDDYTRAHLIETQDRIKRAIEASYSINAP